MKKYLAGLVSLCLFTSALSGCSLARQDEPTRFSGRGEYTNESVAEEIKKVLQDPDESDSNTIDLNDPALTDPNGPTVNYTGLDSGNNPYIPSGPTPTPRPTQAPTPPPTLSKEDQDAESAAKALAQEHLLDPEDLEYQYALFLKFSDVVEENDGLDGYRNLVYQIFPVIADNVEFMDEDYFFDHLATLTIEVDQVRRDLAATYSRTTNTVTMGENQVEAEPDDMPAILYHELMHFLDSCLPDMPSNDDVYILNGEHLTYAELSQHSNDEIRNAVLCAKTDYLTEGGAEYYADKYFSDAPQAYAESICFVAGLEYIMGEPFLNELFFSWDTDAIFEELLYEVGYTHDECLDLSKTMNYLVYSDRYDKPDNPVSPVDVLIDLYEYELGDGWRNDDAFLYIVRLLDWVGEYDIGHSTRDDDLDILTFDERWYAQFFMEFTKDLPQEYEINTYMALPFMRDGRLLIGLYAVEYDPPKGEFCCIAITFDLESFRTGECRSYTINNYAGAEEKYFT